MAEKKSVVLVTVDCLRADHCGFMGYPRPTTPFLNSLAAESMIFPAAIVAGAPTYYSLPSILASRYPLAWGREVLGLAVREKNLASAFMEDGYRTAFCGAANPYLSEQFGYDFGFETFCDFLGDDLPRASDPDDHSTRRGRWSGSLNQFLAKVISPDSGTRHGLRRTLFPILPAVGRSRCAIVGPDASLSDRRCHR